MSLLGTFKAYYYLTKPGIVYGNSITNAGGFLLAADGRIAFGAFLGAISGLMLIMASACVYNNYIDRNIDRVMSRTSRRALARGTISGGAALAHATILGLAGAAVLHVYTNPLALGIALFGLFAYVVLYGIGKRRTVHGTIIGSISGAVPPVVGYCAASGTFDLGALLVFVVLACWQMPHFYAIAIYRRDDYAAARLPILSVVRGVHITKLYSMVYVVAFLIAAASLTVFGYTGYTYLLAVALAVLYWLRTGTDGLTARDSTRWAHRMFGASLVVLLVWSVMISIDTFLP